MLHRRLYMKEQRSAIALLIYCFVVLGVSSWAAFAWGQVAGPEVYQALATQPKVRVVIALRHPTTPPSALTSRRAEIAAMQSKVLSQLSAEDFTLTHRWEALNAMAGEVSMSGLANASPGSCHNGNFPVELLVSYRHYPSSHAR